MIKSLTLPSLLLIALAVLGGCSTVQYDKDTFAVFRLGEFQMLLNTTAPVAYEAAQKAVQQAGLFKTHGVCNKFEAQIFARASNDQKVRINIEEANSRQTLVRIRWGEGGDSARSRKLFDSIEANLK